jgi:hypothetical protein
MPIAWPTGSNFPQRPYWASHTEESPANVVRTQMDTGPAKVRRRATAAPRFFNASTRCTMAQVEVFDAWFTGTLNHGSEEFQWYLPRDHGGTTYNMRLVGNPGYKPLSGFAVWEITYRCEILSAVP